MVIYHPLNQYTPLPPLTHNNHHLTCLPITPITNQKVIIIAEISSFYIICANYKLLIL